MVLDASKPKKPGFLPCLLLVSQISSRTQLITQNSGLQPLSSKKSAKNQCVINSVQLLNTTTAPANLSLQPSTAATNPGSLTVNSANTIPDDILLNGGAIPTMMAISETDDDILIYDKNSLLSSLTSAQTQPIIPLNATTVNSGIYPTANTSADDNNLLINPAASPRQPTSK